MLNFKKLFKKYNRQVLKPAYINNSGTNCSFEHVDHDAQFGHIDNGQ